MTDRDPPGGSPPDVPSPPAPGAPGPSASKSKMKGTMVGVAPAMPAIVGRPGAANIPPPAAVPPPAEIPPPSAPMEAAPQVGAPGGSPSKSKMKGTMVGVAPAMPAVVGRPGMPAPAAPSPPPADVPPPSTPMTPPQGPAIQKSKLKGTMVGVAPAMPAVVGRPGMPAPAAGNVPPPADPGMVPPPTDPSAVPPPGAPIPPPAAAAPVAPQIAKAKFKGTMVGVAPAMPAMVGKPAAPAPAAPGATAPAPAAVAPSTMQAVTAPMPIQPPAAHAPAAAAPSSSPPSGVAPPSPPPPTPVNNGAPGRQVRLVSDPAVDPLGGTMAGGSQSPLAGLIEASLPAQTPGQASVPRLEVVAERIATAPPPSADGAAPLAVSPPSSREPAKSGGGSKMVLIGIAVVLVLAIGGFLAMKGH